MLQCEILVTKFGSAIDGQASSSIAINKITTLDHEVLDLYSV